VTVSAETEIFDEPRHPDIDVQQVLDVRRTLEGVGITQSRSRSTSTVSQGGLVLGALRLATMCNER
jgi:hypothetical protein